MILQYLVCDTPYPVVSVAGLGRLGYNADFDYQKACPKRRGHHRADVTTDRKLYFLEPKAHRRPPRPRQLLDRTGREFLT